MSIRDAYKQTHQNPANPTQPPTRTLEVNMALADKIADALEEQFPGLTVPAKPDAYADFSVVLPDQGDGKKGKAILFRSGKLVLTGHLVNFVLPS